MKASTLGIFRRSPAAYELYAENNPELTRIKVAEHYRCKMDRWVHVYF